LFNGTFGAPDIFFYFSLSLGCFLFRNSRDFFNFALDCSGKLLSFSFKAIACPSTTDGI
jgi:hypothetical protein